MIQLWLSYLRNGSEASRITSLLDAFKIGGCNFTDIFQCIVWFKPKILILWINYLSNFKLLLFFPVCILFRLVVQRNFPQFSTCIDSEMLSLKNEHILLPFLLNLFQICLLIQFSKVFHLFFETNFFNFRLFKLVLFLVQILVFQHCITILLSLIFVYLLYFGLEFHAHLLIFMLEILSLLFLVDG